MQHLFKSIIGALCLFGACALSANAAEENTTKSVLGAAVSGTYHADLTHASLLWRVMHKGLSKYTAKFAKFDAALQFDAAHPEQSKLHVVIDPTSVVTDYPQTPKRKVDWDGELAGPAWFNAAKFPQIEFTATGITRTSDNTGQITGDLHFLGVHKPVTLDVTMNGAKYNAKYKAGSLGFSAVTTFNRSDFGLSRYIPNIGDQVEVIIEIEFNLEQEPKK